MNTAHHSVDEYIATFPADTQIALQEVRKTIQSIAPQASEVISYGMPAYKLNGILVYFAAFKKHIGFYAIPHTHEAFRKELSKYKTGKGSVQFPLDKPMPLDLIKRMVEFRLAENEAKKALK